MHTVTLRPADGIGPEVAHAALAAMAPPGDWTDCDMTVTCVDVASRCCAPVHVSVIASVVRHVLAHSGSVATPSVSGSHSAMAAHARTPWLDASVRSAATLPSAPSRRNVIGPAASSETSEDLCSGREHTVAAGAAESAERHPDRASPRTGALASGGKRSL